MPTPGLFTFVAEMIKCTHGWCCRHCEMVRNGSVVIDIVPSAFSSGITNTSSIYNLSSNFKERLMDLERKLDMCLPAMKLNQYDMEKCLKLKLICCYRNISLKSGINSICS